MDLAQMVGLRRWAGASRCGGLGFAAMVGVGLVVAGSPGVVVGARFVVAGHVEADAQDAYPEAEFILLDAPGGRVLYALDDPTGYLRGEGGSQLRCTVEDFSGMESNAVPLVVVTGMAPSELLAPHALNSTNAPGLWSEVSVGGTTSPDLDSDGDGIPDATDPDDDNDGIPDTYEIDNGLDPLVDDAAGDFDGDGDDNGSEYVAGTRANDPSSRFEARMGPVAGVDVFRLTWLAVPGRMYSVLRWEDLESAPQVLFDGITVPDVRDQSRDVPSTARRSLFSIQAEIGPEP